MSLYATMQHISVHIEGSNVKHIFIINPHAGHKDSTLVLIDKIKTLFAHSGEDFYIFVTEFPGHATELVNRTCGLFSNDEIRIYACGGGGTLFEAVNGIPELKKTELALVPLGKNNDILDSLGQERSAFNDLKRIVEGKTVAIDAMRINNSFYALNNICFGHSLLMKKVFDHLQFSYISSYFPVIQKVLLAVSHALSLRVREYDIDIDGKISDIDFKFSLLMNGIRYEQKIISKKSISITDGILKAFFLKDTNLFKFARQAYAFESGNTGSIKQSIATFEGKNFAIRRKDNSDMVLNVDGELVIVNSLYIAMRHEVVQFVIPTSTIGDN